VDETSASYPEGQVAQRNTPRWLKTQMYHRQFEVKASHELCERRIELQKIELLVLSEAPVREISRYFVM
jgi:hypothetical protein